MSGAVPLVTIGITCFNAQDTIARAIASAQAQDWPTVDIVVVDDHSTDRSLEIVRSLAASDPRLRLVELAQNGGAAAASNVILDNARGDYVAFFDDDDVSLPSRITEQIEALTRCEAETGATLVACFAGGERIYDNGYRVPAPGIGSAGEPPHGEGVANYLLYFEQHPGWFYGAGVPTCALLGRRSTFTSIGGFDPALRRNKDIDLAIRLALAGGYFVGTSNVLYERYMTGGSDKSAEAILKARIQMADKFRQHLEKMGRYDYARIWPQMRYWHLKRNYPRFALELAKLLARHPVATTRHLFSTGPARLVHEWQMKRSAVQ